MEAIAIVGFSFKPPGGAEEASSFWDILQAGRSVMTDWPGCRLNINAFHEADTNKKNIVSDLELSNYVSVGVLTPKRSIQRELTSSKMIQDCSMHLSSRLRREKRQP
jgi:hypothetical protein